MRRLHPGARTATPGVMEGAGRTRVSKMTNNKSENINNSIKSGHATLVPYPYTPGQDRTVQRFGARLGNFFSNAFVTSLSFVYRRVSHQEQ